MPRYFKAKIIENKPLSSCIYLLTVAPLSTIVLPEPGQFCMLQVGKTYDPLLKRPFSVFNVEHDSFQFLYRIKGRGTKCLSSLGKGETLSVVGPLGNTYPIPDDDFIVVAGGVGIASLLFLLMRFRNRAYLFYGGRNACELVAIDRAKEYAKKTVITTDDGSKGLKGLVTEPLKSFLYSREAGGRSLPLYACGSVPMLKEISRVVEGRKIRCYVSLEENMACGVGACLGCVIKVRNDESAITNKRVCKEGPVFDLGDVVWK